MRSGRYVTGSPEANLNNLVGLQVAIDFYGLPSRSMAGMNDAKLVDCQAGYETMQNLSMLLAGGVHIVNQVLGMLDSLMTTTFEKWVIDEEIVRRILRAPQGGACTEDAVAVSSIQTVAHDAAYLTQPDTMRHRRSRWLPALSDWFSHEGWEKAGRLSILERARQGVERALEKASNLVIAPWLDGELERYVERAFGH